MNNFAKGILVAGGLLILGVLTFIPAQKTYTVSENKSAVTLLADGVAVCSGTYIGDDAGRSYILSANHCYEEGKTYDIQFVGSGNKIPVLFSQYNEKLSLPDYDLALFTTSPMNTENVEPMPLYCGDVPVGEQVWMTGNPGLFYIQDADEHMLTSVGYFGSTLVADVPGWAKGFEFFNIQAFGGYSGSGVIMKHGLSHVLTGAYGGGGIAYSMGAPVDPLCSTMFEEME